MNRAPIWPEHMYGDEWLGWAYLFGTGPAKPRRRYAPRRTLAQWVEFAEDLAAQNGGVLPNAKLLRRTHCRLCAMMYKNREAFAHIRQRKFDRWGNEITFQPTA